ncbi:MAG: universal stress protein [Pseudomonadota bacterium]
MKSILVATDLSNRSDRAVQKAFALAEKHDAKLTVLNVVDSDLPTDIAQTMQASAETQIKAHCTSLSKRSCHAMVKVDDPISGIHSVADEVDADVVVLGVHRPRPFFDLFSGSTLERLVRASERPVLLVRDPASGQHQNPVCGIDFSASCVEAARSCAVLVPEARISTFLAVHIPFKGFLAPGGTHAEFQPYIEDAKRRLDTWLSTADLPEQCTPPEVLVGEVQDALNRMLKKVNGDLIVVGAHARVSPSPTYLGTFAQDLVRNPPCDVLVVRN